MIKALLVVAVLVPLVVATPASAWQATGHMIIVQIAYDELDEDARREVDRLVAVLAEFPPRRDHAVTASLWADDLREEGAEAFDHWHYTNHPVRAGFEGVIPPLPTENVVWAIEQAIATLESDAGDFAKAMMLRFLLHFVGDIHQPLHCSTRYTPEQPTGDRGGNDFPLLGESEQLHRFWDLAAGAFPVLDDTNWQGAIRRLADETRQAVPRKVVPHWKDGDPDLWARESFVLARDVAYRGVIPGSKPSAEYTARAREVTQQRIALGGYRLGALLNELFGRGSAALSVSTSSSEAPPRR